MLPLSNKVSLSSTDGSVRLVLATRYLVQINYTFDMIGVTKLTSHTSHFCVRKEQIYEFVCCTDQGIMSELQDNDSDGYIKISFKEDTIHVHAQIGGSHEENISIEYITGSSALFKFTAGLRELLNNEDIY